MNTNLFPNDKTPENLRTHFSAQKAAISWQELESFLKQDVVVEIDASLDLIEVALCFVLDDSKQVQEWMQNKLLNKISEKEITDMQEKVNALVTSPWVLIQKIEE